MEYFNKLSFTIQSTKIDTLKGTKKPLTDLILKLYEELCTLKFAIRTTPILDENLRYHVVSLIYLIDKALMLSGAVRPVKYVVTYDLASIRDSFSLKLLTNNDLRLYNEFNYSSSSSRIRWSIYTIVEANTANNVLPALTLHLTKLDPSFTKADLSVDIVYLEVIRTPLGGESYSTREYFAYKYLAEQLGNDSPLISYIQKSSVKNIIQNDIEIWKWLIKTIEKDREDAIV